MDFPTTPEIETGGLKIKVYLGNIHQFKYSLGNVARPCLKNTYIHTKKRLERQLSGRELAKQMQGLGLIAKITTNWLLD